MQHTLRHAIRSILIAGLLILPFGVSAERETIDLSKRGPQVGEAIPQFSLPDQHGKMWTEKSIMGESGTMLVFIRSANW